MKELHAEGIANRSDPESCGRHRKVPTEALTGAPAGADTESRKLLPDADPLTEWGRPHVERRYSEVLGDPAGSKTRRTSRTFKHENREAPVLPRVCRTKGRLVKGSTRTTSMYGTGESDDGVVPMNDRRQPPRFGREGRRLEGSRLAACIGTLCPIHATICEYASVRSTLIPEVGAVCGNSACTDLSGGRPERAVPTAHIFATLSIFATLRRMMRR